MLLVTQRIGAGHGMSRRAIAIFKLFVLHFLPFYKHLANMQILHTCCFLCHALLCARVKFLPADLNLMIIFSSFLVFLLLSLSLSISHPISCSLAKQNLFRISCSVDSDKESIYVRIRRWVRFSGV